MGDGIVISLLSFGRKPIVWLRSDDFISTTTNTLSLDDNWDDGTMVVESFVLSSFSSVKSSSRRFIDCPEFVTTI